MNDLLNQRFDKLFVVRKAATNEIKNKTQKRVYWVCKCDCGNEKVVSSSDLICHRIRSCGCLKFDAAQKRRKENKYDLTGEYGIGFTSKGDKFFFDKEDYMKISKFCWHKRKDGYFDAKVYRNQRILLHDLIAETKYVDHKNGNLADNRKSNLRTTINLDYNFNTYNQMNRIKQKNNNSGVTGVYQKGEKWVSIIYVNNKNIYLGTYNSFNKAVKVRKEAEQKYFGLWSFDNSRNEGLRNVESC